MKMMKETTGETVAGSRFDDYQPSFGTAFVQGSGWALSVVSSLCRTVIQLALFAALAFGSYWLISQHVLQSVEVSGKSMHPTLQNGEHCLLDRWTYLLREPQPNDIVVLRDPLDGVYSVKRVIATSGDSIRFKDGQVFLNGRKLDEPYLTDGTFTYGSSNRSGDQWVVVGENQYFVLGDNRNNSEDSRSYGPVSREQIAGTLVR